MSVFDPLRTFAPKPNGMIMNRLFLPILLCCCLTACSSNREPSLEADNRTGVVLVRERANAPEFLHNFTVDEGRFAVRNGCLSVVVNGKHYTPVLPQSSRFLPGNARLHVGSAEVHLGPLYSLPFANEIERGKAELLRGVDLPAECERRLMRMGQPTPL